MENVGVEVTYDVPRWYGRPLGPEEVRLWMSARINRGSGKKVQVLGAINPVKQWHSLLKVLTGFFSVPRGLSRAFGSISRSFRATPLTSSVIIIICGPSHPLWGRIESQHVQRPCSVGPQYQHSYMSCINMGTFKLQRSILTLHTRWMGEWVFYAPFIRPKDLELVE